MRDAAINLRALPEQRDLIDQMRKRSSLNWIGGLMTTTSGTHIRAYG